MKRLIPICVLYLAGAIGILSAPEDSPDGLPVENPALWAGRVASRLAAVECRLLTDPPRLVAGSREILLSEGSRRILTDGRQVYLNAPLLRVDDGLNLHTCDLAFVVEPLLAAERTLPIMAPIVLALDAGHGGQDNGASRHKPRLIEKELTLDIVLRCRRHLQQSGAAVFLTREDDVPLTINERARIAAGVGADLMVSVHINSADNDRARGIETYTLAARGYASTAGNPDPDPGENAAGHRYAASAFRLAWLVQQNLLAATQAEDRGVRHGHFTLLRQASCPAILVECGFMSNRSEARLLRTHSYREGLAAALASGIQAYIEEARQREVLGLSLNVRTAK